MDTDKHIIQQTQNWLCRVIIKNNFCPFAKKVYDQGEIRFGVSHKESLDEHLALVIEECVHLDTNPAIETTLFIIPNDMADFNQYLSFVDLSTGLLQKRGYEGTYQLASFHPNYQFADSMVDDAANYTNRSPYPMLHIIRETSISKALKHYPNPEDIPQRNISVARSIGTLAMQTLLQSCIEDSKI